ncbi:unnamed protein product [Caenorhabditis brenneri]
MRVLLLFLLAAFLIGAYGQVSLMVLKYFMYHTKYSHPEAVKVLRHHAEMFLQLVQFNDPENLFEMFEVNPQEVAVWNLTEHPEVEGFVVVSSGEFVTYEKWNLIKNPNSVTGWKVKNEDFLRYILCDGKAYCTG